ncbi:MAG: hypothetical protein GXY09_11580 [Bacteroidales bacterium]|jgi:hypothetical protein|nr:hypothetical protein [Bacteroidales bacterium]
MKRHTIALICLLGLLQPLTAQKQDKTEPVVTTQTETGVVVLLKNKTLQLQNIKVGDKIQVLNVLGVKVLEKKSDSTIVDIQLNLSPGYYIVKVGSTVRKISLK